MPASRRHQPVIKFECCHCFGEYEGTHVDAAREGWSKGIYTAGAIWLCPGCTEMYDKRREIREKLQEAA